MPYYTSPAVEGLFDPEATTASLLATVKENVTNKVTTIEQAVDLEDRLSDEAAKFNEYLSTISDAMRKCKAGEISREDALAQAKPCVAELKERCEALNLGGISVSDSDITENEIAMLREYIVGCKDIVAKHKQYLQDNCADGCESFLDVFDDEIATEGGSALYKSFMNSTDVKTAKLLFKQATKLYRMGSKENAKKYMMQAKAKYQKCLADIEKTGKRTKVTRETTVNAGTFTTKDIDKNYTAYTDYNFASAASYFENRIDECEAYLRQWTNKAGALDLAETKALLKEERKNERARIRAERKGMESTMPEVNILEEYLALEAMMDEYETDLAMAIDEESCYEFAALEADSAESASDLGGRMRSGFKKLGNAFKSGDKKAADAANAEIEAAVADMTEADNSADAEGKKKLSTAAKIGLVAGAAALLIGGDIAAGQLLRKKAEKANANGKEFDIKGLGALIVRSSNAMVRLVTKKGSAMRGKLDASTANIKAAAANRRNTAAYDKSVKPGALKHMINSLKLKLRGFKGADKQRASLQRALAKLEAQCQAAIDAGDTTKANQLAAQIGVLNAEINKLTTGTEAAIMDVDYMLAAMEEANFSDEVSLDDLDNEEGRAFDSFDDDESDVTEDDVLESLFGRF